MGRKSRFSSAAAALTILIFSGCAARYPTEKEWGKTPIFQKDNIEFKMQGQFKSVGDFVRAARELKDGMTIAEIKQLGFDTEGKNGCEKIGWVDASNIVLANTQLNLRPNSNINDVLKEKSQYEGIGCEIVDAKTRTDRLLTYFNNSDTYKIGRKIKMVLIFKNRVLVGININDQPIREHERKRAFAKVFGDIFDIFPLNPAKIVP